MIDFNEVTITITRGRSRGTARVLSFSTEMEARPLLALLDVLKELLTHYSPAPKGRPQGDSTL